MIEPLIRLMIENPATALNVAVPLLAVMVKLATHYNRHGRVSRGSFQMICLASGVLVMVVIPWPMLQRDLLGPPQPYAAGVVVTGVILAAFVPVGLALILVGLSDSVCRRVWKFINRSDSYTGIETIDY